MGLIHTRARKQRDRQEARLLKVQRQVLEEERTADLPWYRQPTLGGAIHAARQRRSQHD